METYICLEKELESWTGMPEVAVCSSGTAGLHLSLEALNMPQGSVVVLPDFTMIACARAVSLSGMTPAFVDCQSKDLNIDGEILEMAVGVSTKAVMAVHIYGRRCNMDLIAGVAKRRGLFLIEDMSEIHGVTPHPDTDAAVWSFYKGKIVGGEEGGAVGFRDPKHAALARRLRSLGFTEEHNFTHVPRGCNYRLSNVNAQLIRESLYEYNWKSQEPRRTILGQRREAEKWYDDLCPDEWRMPPRDAPWIYDVRIPGMSPIAQDAVVHALKKEGIAARHSFKPMHEMEEYRHCPVYGNGNAAVASREVFYLPLDPGKVTRATAAKAFEVIRKVVG